MEADIRVFISYSKDDIELVKRIIQKLEMDGIVVLWTNKIPGGAEYVEQLQIFIEHAHIFMPIITESSSARGWVHQEIGYAIALNVPVFPILIEDVTPIGMIEKFQHVKLSLDTESLLEDLNQNKLNAFLNKDALPAFYQRAENGDVRSGLMKQYSDKVSQMNKSGIVRQKGGLSSFHIPNKYIEHQIWTDRYAKESRSSQHKQVQLGERIALQQHADAAGCKLIINPSYAKKENSVLAEKTRIKTLIDYLDMMSNDKVVVAIQNGAFNNKSLTIVGDWFLAESVSFKIGDGFTNTFFTRNASEISKRIKAFEEELDELLGHLGWTRANSREKALEELERIISSLEE